MELGFMKLLSDDCAQGLILAAYETYKINPNDSFVKDTVGFVVRCLILEQLEKAGLLEDLKK